VNFVASGLVSVSFYPIALRFVIIDEASRDNFKRLTNTTLEHGTNMARNSVSVIIVAELINL